MDSLNKKTWLEFDKDENMKFNLSFNPTPECACFGGPFVIAGCPCTCIAHAGDCPPYNCILFC